jgi:CSLREA domain-containing protein
MKNGIRFPALTTGATPAMRRPRADGVTGWRVMSRVPLLVLLLLAMSAAVLALPSTPAHAGTTYVVTRTTDTPFDEVCDTDCSLREAIWFANGFGGADTIIVPAGTYTLDVVGAGEENNEAADLDILDELTINGAGAGSTIIDGNGAVLGDRVIQINGAFPVTLSGVTVRNGNTSGSGAGIYNGGLLTLNNSTVSGNSALFDGGGISNPGTLTLNGSTVSGNNAGGNGGGVHSSGTLTLNSSTVSGNTAGNFGSGINGAGTVTLNGSAVSDNTGSNFGGALYTAATATLNNSVVSANLDFGIYNGGNNLTLSNSTVSANYLGLYNFGTASVDNTTVSGNLPYGGIVNFGSGVTVTGSTISGNVSAVGQGFAAGIANSAGSVTVTNSTVSGNTSGLGGTGGISNGGTFTLLSSTVANNTGSYGGILNNVGTFNIKNSIVTNGCTGTLTSNGYNLSSDATCSLTNPGDIIDSDPLLGPLAYNGGPTQTHALLFGSPALNNGAHACPAPAADQRGVSRPQGPRCDIGAFEALDTDGDATPDAFDDNDDNDGVLDYADPCPLAAEDYDGFLDNDGCPEPDNDGDGVCDAGQVSVSCTGSDSGKPCFDPAGTLSCPTTDCRNVAEDIDAFKDGDGCPEPDNDNDGKLDAADVCPGTNAHAGANGMLGSPEDLNHNGIKDASEASLTTDDSVLVFEDYDGVLDADGCHDSPGDDFDGDGFTDDVEALAIGTNPGRGCAATATANDEDPDPFPSDADDNQKVNIGDVIILFSGKILNPPAYTPRSDFDDNGAINIGDVIIGFSVKAHIFDECAPGPPPSP